MFHVRANGHLRSRATPAIAALRFPIQSRGARSQIVSCASSVDTGNSLPAICIRLLIRCLMFVNMKPRPPTQTFVRLGTVVSRIAAKLIATHDPNKVPVSAHASKAGRALCDPAPSKNGVAREVPAQGAPELLRGCPSRMASSPGKAATSLGGGAPQPETEFRIALECGSGRVDGRAISAPLQALPSFVSHACPIGWRLAI